MLAMMRVKIAEPGLGGSAPSVRSVVEGTRGPDSGVGPVPSPLAFLQGQPSSTLASAEQK